MACEAPVCSPISAQSESAVILCFRSYYFSILVLRMSQYCSCTSRGLRSGIERYELEAKAVHNAQNT